MFFIRSFIIIIFYNMKIQGVLRQKQSLVRNKKRFITIRVGRRKTFWIVYYIEKSPIHICICVGVCVNLKLYYGTRRTCYRTPRRILMVSYILGFADLLQRLFLRSMHEIPKSGYTLNVCKANTKTRGFTEDGISRFLRNTCGTYTLIGTTAGQIH